MEDPLDDRMGARESRSSGQSDGINRGAGMTTTQILKSATSTYRYGCCWPGLNDMRSLSIGHKSELS